MKTNIFNEIKALCIDSNEQYLLQDEEGNLHSIVPGKSGKIVKVTSKSELYQLLFDKQRIGIDEIKSIEAIDFDALKKDLVSVIYNNFTYNVKKEAQTEIKDLIAKYGLKPLQERAKKSK